MSLTKQALSCDASSADNGGTRRVFTSPLRGAFTMTANAYLPALGDKPVGTLTSLPTRCVDECQHTVRAEAITSSSPVRRSRSRVLTAGSTPSQDIRPPPTRRAGRLLAQLKLPVAPRTRICRRMAASLELP